MRFRYIPKGAYVPGDVVMGYTLTFRTIHGNWYGTVTPDSATVLLIMSDEEVICEKT